MTIKALIVDDEQLARDELQYLLGSIEDVEVVAQGKNGIEAIALVPRLAPDVVFLDVQMPGLDGFAVLRKLLEKSGPETLPQIIFATAFDKYAVRAFEVNAVDYLLKPFDRSRLEQALERVRARLQNPAQGSQEPAASGPGTPALSREQIDSLIRLIEQQSGETTGNGRSSSKIVVQAGTRMLLVDQKELCFAA
ncbi:MAG TPA: response regulator, partial [Acidobacteriaceae bacterium]|nr:response regulator [Acidobacteriaceae bacterium]